MGVRFRRSVKVAPGVRINVGQKSASVSVGPKGAKYTVSTTGQRRTTVGIPGTGLSYTSTSGGSSNQQVPVMTTQCVASPKSKRIALVLCLFLGFLGVHRYYVGKIGTGILWTLTCGVFAVGWIYDIIMILLGNFDDANDLPLKKKAEEVESVLMDEQAIDGLPPEEQ